MLHTINEVVELTGRSRSTIYRMFDRGEINYSVGRDGKRRVETSELLRVFDDVRMDREPVPTVSHTLETLAAEARNPESAAAPVGMASEMRELRDLVRHLQDEVEHIREDNSRLLRLLEYRTYDEDAEAEMDEHTVPPVTEVARGGWQNYRQQRRGAQASTASAQTAVVPPSQTDAAPAGSAPTAAAPHPMPQATPDAADLRQAGQVLGAWLKNFFLGDWQKRDV